MSLICGNWRSETRTPLARNCSRKARSLKSPDSLRSRTSNPVSLPIATRAERSAGCSYARELIPGRRPRARSGTGVISRMVAPPAHDHATLPPTLQHSPAARPRTRGRCRYSSVMSAAREGRRVGVMGGTFDPVHHGHLVAASEVGHIFELDEVIFVPTGEPWQKEGRDVSAAEDRYLMTVIATASNPRFSVSRVDIDRPGPTYTIDTLKDLRAAAAPEDEFFFITGADALATMLSWHDVEDLCALAHFIDWPRPGPTGTEDGMVYGKVSLVEIPALAISSSECRARVADGEPVWYLVPDGVVQYIAKRNLYCAPDDPLRA